MTCHFQVLLGPGRSGKTTQLIERYAARLVTDMSRRALGRTMWIAPNRFAVANVRRRLLERLPSGCFAANVLTFEQFAERVLATSPAPVLPISRVQKRDLVRQIVRRLVAAGELPYMASVAAKKGLVDSVAAQISELKRLEVWPDQFEAACGTSAKDRDLARVYREYQDVLTRHRLYDAEGRFWSARTLLVDGHRDSIKPLELVIVDGFTDFTRPQHEMVEALAEEVAEVVISLSMDVERRDESSIRRDLFSKCLAMLQELKRRHRGLEVAEADGRSGSPNRTANEAAASGSGSPKRTYGGIASVCDRLFRPPDAVLPPPPRANIEIWQTVSQTGEIQQIARDIKQRLLAGEVVADELVVVFRSLGEVAPIVADVFEEYGVPAEVEFQRPIQAAPGMRALLLLLRLDQRDWRYDDVLAVIRNHCIAWPSLANAESDTACRMRTITERHVRRLQIPGGREALLGQLRRLAGAAHGESGSPRSDGWGRSAAEPPGATAPGSLRSPAKRGTALGESSPLVAAVVGLEALAALLDRLPQAATPGEWAVAIYDLLATCQLGGEEDGDAALADERARACLIEALYSVQRLDDQAGDGPRRLTRAEACELLTDIAQHECLPQAPPAGGQVRVLSAISARGVEARHLYFAGLTEHAMPQAAGELGYYCPREKARLIREGLPLVGVTRQYEEEMLLFYEVISRASDRLVLSYAALDEKAQPILPSPFLSEARRAAGDGIATVERLDLRPVDRERAPLCLREFRTRAVCDAVVDGTGDERLQLALAAGGSWGGSILAGLSIVAARAERESFGPAEGIFTSAAAKRLLSEQFGPQYHWSPTALERFATCPFRFLLEKVLGVEPLDDLELSTDHRRRGGIAHQCLAELYSRLERVQETATLSSQTDAERVKALMLSFIEEELARLERGGFSQALVVLDLEQVRRFSETLHLQQQCYDKFNGELDGPPWPVHFEVRFGPPRDGQSDGEDPLSKDDPFELDLGGEKIKLTGRVDRIDIGSIGGTTVFNIIDYKTGTVKPLHEQNIRCGMQLQIPLYALAVEEHLLVEQGAVAWQADYWWLGDSGFGNKGAKARGGPFALRTLTDEGLVELDQWKELKAELVDCVRRIVHGVRRGEFVVFSQDPDCTGSCAYSGVCRVSQVRSLEKEWEHG